MQPILKVDLSTGKIEKIEVPRSWEEEYLGGASLAARMLYEHLTPSLEPLSPEAPLLFLNGPLTGTAGPTVGRFVVCARSPATRIWGEANVGGFWGPELRMAGYNGLWLQGKASQPVYLWIQDENVEIRPATHLWGMETYATQKAVLNEVNAANARVAVIGPAGEHAVPFSIILTDHGRCAGRTGMGAVMGSKNLKAIAVKGHGKVPILGAEAYALVRSEANRMLFIDNKSKVLRELGTSGAAEYYSYLNEMPVKYFHKGCLDEEIQVSGAAMKETILTGVSACHACVVACGRVVRLADGVRRKGPEYETMVGFGANLMLNDLEIPTRLGELCDRLGMDTISMSNILGLAFHLYELGKITSEDTGGKRLQWGDASPLADLIWLTSQREGFGALLAEGARRLAQHFGAEEEAVQVNGLEVPYHDPRGGSGMALVYATSPRGACHNQSDYFFVDMGQIEPEIGVNFHDRLGGAEKAASVAAHQDWHTLFNSLVICILSIIPPQTVVNLINTACNYSFSLPDLLKISERGFNLKRVINNRLGVARQNDKLPKALLIPYSDNPDGLQGYVPPFESMLEAYYNARGWDANTGLPRREKLAELGLDWISI